MTTRGRASVAALGEEGLLERIAARIGPGPPGETWAGDDSAVLSPAGGRPLVTTDALVEGIDFDLAYATGADAGWKALAAGASDIAAMGGRPRHALLALTLQPETPLRLVDELLGGLLEAAATYEVAVVGGDISRGTELSLTVTLLGEAEAPVLRSGAHEGDALCVTGALGGAAGGLWALRRWGPPGDFPPGPSRRLLAGLARRQLRPRARIEEGRGLARLGATSMIDISDGLVLDLRRLLRASDTGCDADLGSVPVDPRLEAVTELDPSFDPLEAALAGGEDYELLFTIGEDAYRRMRSTPTGLGRGVTRLGTVGAGEAALGGRSLEQWEEAGWDHLRGP